MPISESLAQVFSASLLIQLPANTPWKWEMMAQVLKSLSLIPARMEILAPESTWPSFSYCKYFGSEAAYWSSISVAPSSSLIIPSVSLSLFHINEAYEKGKYHLGYVHLTPECLDLSPRSTPNPSFLLICILRDSGWCLRYLHPCHACGRLHGIPGSLVSTWLLCAFGKWINTWKFPLSLHFK